MSGERLWGGNEPEWSVSTNFEPLLIPDIDRTRCDLLRAGHDVAYQHWKASSGATGETGVVVGIARHGWITVDFSTETRRFWNHATARAWLIFKASGEQVVFFPHYGLLSAPHPNGSYLISVADEEQGATPCARRSTP